MKNLLFSISQIKVYFIRSKSCLIESLGRRLMLFTLIYILGHYNHWKEIYLFLSALKEHVL